MILFISMEFWIKNRIDPTYCNMAKHSTLKWSLTESELTLLKKEINKKKNWSSRRRGVMKLFKDWKFEFIKKEQYLALTIWTAYTPAHNIGNFGTNYELKIKMDDEVIKFNEKKIYRISRGRGTCEPLNPSISHCLSASKLSKVSKLCFIGY
eukprot:154470_1